jgi:MoxR-like ATPase
MARVRERVSATIVGQSEVIGHLLVALLADGHVLLEGPPGLGKTLMVRTLAGALDLTFRRVQCTPDLLPSDITGSLALVAGAHGPEVRHQEGPVFTQILLADEINRTTPKTQSALLEAMEERTVTAGGVTRALPDPFLVLATQNPIDMEGTYPLPEAQLDRFLSKVLVRPPTTDDLVEILRRSGPARDAVVAPVLDVDRFRAARDAARSIVVAPALMRGVAELVQSTHPGSSADDRVRRFVRHGASPRGAIATLAAARARALLAGRPHVSREDLVLSACAALRHRLLLTFEAETEGVTSDDVLAPLLAQLG